MEVFCETARDVPEMPLGMTASEDNCANYSIQKNTLVVFKKVGVQKPRRQGAVAAIAALGYGKDVWEFFRLNNFLVEIQTPYHKKYHTYRQE